MELDTYVTVKTSNFNKGQQRDKTDVQSSAAFELGCNTEQKKMLLATKYAIVKWSIVGHKKLNPLEYKMPYFKNIKNTY